MPLEDFSPPISAWFIKTFGSPTQAQARAWPLIRRGSHVLLSAPTGSGKTLAAFLVAIERIGRKRMAGDRRRREGASVLYVSPLRSLVSDVATNLVEPLSAIGSLDPAFEGIEVGVRTGDTAASARSRQVKRPPDIVATTPESLALMLLSEGGRKILSTVEYVIVDEIHAVVGSKRGPQLALSLELLEDLVAPSGRQSPEESFFATSWRPGYHRRVGLQRVGLSATQEPITSMARFLGGVGREVAIVDCGRFRAMDVQIELGSSEVGAVCSGEEWSAIYEKVAALVQEHRSSLVFVATRRMAERVGARLGELLGNDVVASHHGSLSKERRQTVESRLKAGELKAVVATSSLELGIDIGDVDLVIQIGSPKSVTTATQRIGRSGHAVSGLPKGRIFPLTVSELEEVSSIVGMMRDGLLDSATFVEKPLDVLAQECVAACVMRPRQRDELFKIVRRAWPYRDLTAGELDSVLQLHSKGRWALLHLDPVSGVVRATRRARLHCLTNSGTIPDTGEYEVVQIEDGSFLGSLDEDFAIESAIGDVFQLGNSSWRVSKVRQGQVLVSEAGDVPATFPFWFGEGPFRSREVGERIGRFRQAWLELYQKGVDRSERIEWIGEKVRLNLSAASRIDDYLAETANLLGTLPTHSRVVAERFFDHSGGMQLVVHAPFGSRINRAWGLALRKKFCRSFGFELQAAAGDDGLLISLSTMHSFPVEEVFEFLSPESVRHVLEQAVIGTPLFATRWRWAAVCSLLVERNRAGGKIPINLQRTIAQDRLAEAFPQSLACFETLPPGDIPVPLDHPVVRQTLRDCLEYAMDTEELVRVVERLKSGQIERVAVDVPFPSPMAEGILQAKPYEFLDDAPLEERRAHAVPGIGKRPRTPYSGSIDAEVARRVRQRRWPRPDGVEELHHTLVWMGFVTEAEAASSGWNGWLEQLAEQGRVEFEEGRWKAKGVKWDWTSVAEGRLQALGFVAMGEEPLVGSGGRRALLELEAAGKALRVRVGGETVWAERRAASEGLKLTRRKLLESFSPVTIEAFQKFLNHWNHLCEETRLEGPEGVVEAALCAGGLPVEAGRLEREFLSERVRGYRPEWLDSAISSGRIVWFRAGPYRRVAFSKLPICLVPFADAHIWYSVWGGGADPQKLSGNAAAVYEILLERGPRFFFDLEREAGIPSAWLERAIEELITLGLVTADSFSLARWMLRAKRLRALPIRITGRVWAIQRELICREKPDGERISECVAKGLLARMGIVWRERFLECKVPLPWGDIRSALRRLEQRGEARWGRFVRSGSGEQFAAPTAPEYLARIAALGQHADSG
ncbi:MAG: ATP-dependent DNA helicase [Acidimicrobiia bacterium]